MQGDIKNYFARASTMMGNIKTSGRSKAKRLGIPHTQSHVNIDKTKLANLLKNCDKLICPFCETPIKIWVIAGPECISCDRITKGHIGGLYSCENIRFSHQKCNTLDGPKRNDRSVLTKEYFRRFLSEVGVVWCEPDSAEGIEILNKNDLYFSVSRNEQISIEYNPNKIKNMKNENTKTVKFTVSGIPIEMNIDDLSTVTRNVIDQNRTNVLSELTKVGSSTGHVIKSNGVRPGIRYENSLTSKIRNYCRSLPGKTEVSTATLRVTFNSIGQSMLCNLAVEKDPCIIRKSKGMYLTVPGPVSVEVPEEKF